MFWDANFRNCLVRHILGSICDSGNILATDSALPGDYIVSIQLRETTVAQQPSMWKFDLLSTTLNDIAS